MDIPKSAKRSACDRCRAKRVRCPRPEGSTAPCARCVHIGARCVTGSPGYPGRPRKAGTVDKNAPGSPTMICTDDGTSSSISRRTQRDGDHVELQTPVAEEPTSVNMSMYMDMSTACSGADVALSNPLDVLGGVGNVDYWTTPGSANFFDFLLTNGSPASDSIPTQVVEQSSNLSQQHELLCTVHSVNMMREDQCSNTLLGVDSLLESSQSLSGQNSSVQCPSAAILLMRFQEKMEQRVTTMSAFFSDPRNVVEDCKADDFTDIASENPVAIILMCTKEFIDIMHKLTTATQHVTASPYPDEFTSKYSTLVQPNAMPPCTTQPKSPSTETVLLVLSSYLALMKLYDSLFHGVHRCFRQMPAEAIKSIKVKAVFRIAGVSSLQDMPVKAYAMGIIDVIQNQVKDLERCMGLPAEYCLSSEVTAKQSSHGLFANGDRAQLFRTVMEQEDVKPQGGKHMSYVESIRKNIEESIAYFGD